MDMLLVILMAKKLLEYFIKKNCKKKRGEFRIEKVIKKESDKLYVKWKGLIIHLKVGLMKKMLYKNESIFS